MLDRACALAPEIAAASNRIEAERELPGDLVRRLIEAGLFRMLQPRSVGGAELHPLEFAEVTAGAGGGRCLGRLVRVPEQRVRDDGGVSGAGDRAGGLWADDWDPRLGTARSPYPAHPVAGGYRISGKWRFASGSHHATWLGAHAPVAGTDTVRTLLFPKSSATMRDIWHVVGLRGTGSDEYVVDDLFVPEEFTCDRDNPAEWL